MQHRQQRQRIWTWDKVSHIHPIFLGRMAIADGNLKGPQHRTGSMNGFAENSHILRAAQRSCLYLELLNMIRSADAGHQGGAGIWDVPIKLEFEKTREEAATASSDMILSTARLDKKPRERIGSTTGRHQNQTKQKEVPKRGVEDTVEGDDLELNGEVVAQEAFKDGHQVGGVTDKTPESKDDTVRSGGKDILHILLSEGPRRRRGGKVLGIPEGHACGNEGATLSVLQGKTLDGIHDTRESNEETHLQPSLFNQATRVTAMHDRV
ncbi:hypothetical protein EDD18DRAFT_1328605 [Armillaria luteobubalina]|uniref:Uncharacterized protein n=1 Tax=Armillaria luteobubalina TaxID=153913 RepID=A0AA39UXB9_9AGAR|nr:hypothetical protein EDD18DRAFT_1328605 [Armillaria luteobubalina]